ncbi:MAG: ABC transporter permease [Desulfuromonas thiophila]|jgi:lipopolysaccharide transport system permease protein|nr:ABC transporter permease [Desulfuromonas thiophila]
MQQFSIHPRQPLVSFWRHRQLVFSLVRQEVLVRYRGSILGLLWSFFNPVFMLLVYTFVFSVVFQARWDQSAGGSKAEFALVLFAGLLLFNLLAECFTRAPSLILQNPSYVKRVVFPLEILPLVTFGSAVFHTSISLLVLLVFSCFVFGLPPVTALLFPLLLLPLSAIALAGGWLLSSLGVYLRDVAQVVSLLVTAWMFLTPIFYPVSIIPAEYQLWMQINPLSFLVDQARNLLLFGRSLDWSSYFWLTLASYVVAWLAFVWFQKTRRGFADVL